MSVQVILLYKKLLYSENMSEKMHLQFIKLWIGIVKIDMQYGRKTGNLLLSNEAESSKECLNRALVGY
jgi:hypothetical protein